MNKWILAASALLALVIGIYAASLFRGDAPEQTTEISLSDLSLMDLEGNQQPLQQWQGKLLLVNFWATWCPPCIEEIPLFMRLRDKYADDGFEVIGIAIDEAQKVRDFQQVHAVSFPLLLGGNEGMSLMQRFDNKLGALPYSVLFDKQGNAVHSKPGAFSETELDTLLLKYLKDG